MEHKIITAGTAEHLNEKIAKMISEGWTPIGSHTAVEIHHQNRYAGSQHMDTQIRVEYAQTMTKP